MPRPRCPGRTRMHHTDHAGWSSTCGIFVDRAKGRSARGRDRRPPDDLVAVVGEHARLGALARQRLDVGPAVWPGQLAVVLRRDAVAQAPAHVGRRVLRADHRAHVVEARVRRRVDDEPAGAHQGRAGHAATLDPSGAEPAVFNGRCCTDDAQDRPARRDELGELRALLRAPQRGGARASRRLPLGAGADVLGRLRRGRGHAGRGGVGGRRPRCSPPRPLRSRRPARSAWCSAPTRCTRSPTRSRPRSACR